MSKTREQEAEYFATHCASCGKKDPPFVRVYCGECFHPYLIPMVGLVFHDWWDRVRFSIKVNRYILMIDELQAAKSIPRKMGKTEWKARGKLLLRNLKPRRFKDIIGCPCCAHDL